MSKKSASESAERSLPRNLSESDQRISRKTGRRIYQADYGDATPEEVAKAILAYRR